MRVLTSLALLGAGACGSEAASDDATTTAPAEEAAEPNDDAPPTRPLERPADEEVGTRPEGLGLAIGSSVPDATVSSFDGSEVSLAELYAEGPALVVFYRGGWCPFCNAQVRELAQNQSQFQERDITPVLVSVDRPSKAARTRATMQVPFPLLSDPDLHAHNAFEVVHQADPDEVERLRGFGMDIEAASGRDHHQYAVPSIFLVGTDGKVRWSHVDLDYRRRPKVEQILSAVDTKLD